ncbi:PAS domain-containing protein, partial [Zavarzinia sp.]|uniref:PAS domain-containing protein n=1 Tax=Zavarzinia sp. TaxID=2027920 RepID=UPI003567D466
MALIRRPFAIILPAAGLGLAAVLWQTGDLSGRGFVVAGAGLALAAVAGTRWRPRRPGGAAPLAPENAPDESAEALARLEERLKAASRELKEAVAGHRAVLDLLPDPLILIDAEHQVRLANRAARAMFGEEPVGRPLAAMLRHPEILESVDDVIAGDEPAAEIEISLPVPVARELICRVVAFDKVRPEGVVAALVFRDLTQSKRVERMRADFVANAS